MVSRAREWSRRPPTWLLGVSVALLAWRVGFGAPAPGLDASWNAGLAMAAKQGLQFGTEIVFSYGPLGFLAGHSAWYGDLSVLAFLHTALVYVAFCIALVWALRRNLPASLSAVMAFAAVVLLPFLELPLLLVVLACMGMLERERSGNATNLFLAGGAAFAALESLIKLSTGPVIAALILITLIGLRAPWWKALAFLALTGAGTLLLWLATGQSLATIPDFLGNTWQIVSGYSSAMIRDADVPTWKVITATIAAALASVALAVASYRVPYPQPRARWAATALMALAIFTVFKEGVVRTDAAHLSLYFSTACILWIAIPWTRAQRRWMLAGGVLMALVGLPVRPPDVPVHANPVSNLSYAAEQAHTLLDSLRRRDLIDSGKEGLFNLYALDPGTLAALREHTVAVEPWETAVVWAYDFEWDPLPVYQNYSAYTPALDDLNAGVAASTGGPERILRENPLLVYPEFPSRGLDDRFPGWDPPEQAREVLCHFAPLRTTARWQVLGRTGNRCEAPRLLTTVERDAGMSVKVPAPAPDEAVFARIEGAGVGGLERLTTMLLHARERNAVVNGARTYRLVPNTTGDGLLLRAGVKIAEPGPFSPFPQAKTIAVNGAQGTLRYSFFAMRVQPPGRRSGNQPEQKAGP